jgi:hypothetical protein
MLPDRRPRINRPGGTRSPCVGVTLPSQMMRVWYLPTPLSKKQCHPSRITTIGRTCVNTGTILIRIRLGNIVIRIIRHYVGFVEKSPTATCTCHPGRLDQQSGAQHGKGKFLPKTQLFELHLFTVSLSVLIVPSHHLERASSLSRTTLRIGKTSYRSLTKSAQEIVRIYELPDTGKQPTTLASSCDIGRRVKH